MQLNEEQVQELAHRICSDYTHAEAAEFRQYKFGKLTLLQFARALESALRAQADARPVATVVAVDEYGPRLEWEKHWVECIGAKLYTHPEASAPGLSDEEIIDLWNRAAGDVSGIKARAIAFARAILTRASAATVAENNTPIEKLLAHYASEECDFNDVQGMAGNALRYAETMPDSHARCLLYKLGQHVLNQSAATVAEPSTDAVGGLKAQATITLRQAESLLQFFGGHDAEVAIAQYEGGLIAWCTECPEEGSFWLGKTEIDDELADKGRPQAAQQQAEPDEGKCDCTPGQCIDPIGYQCKGTSQQAEHVGIAPEHVGIQQDEPGADERATFEAWATKEFDLHADGLTRRGDEYKYTAICDAWAAWQARAAQSGQRAGVPENDPYCPRCKGHGEETAMSNNGPDAEELTIACQHCGGEGSLAEAYKGVAKLLAEEQKKYLEACGKLWFERHGDAGQRVGVPIEAVAKAYGYLWHVNEMNADFARIYPPAKAAYAARKVLREFLTHEQRGEAINEAGREIGRYVDESDRAAAPTQQQEGGKS